MKSFLFDCDDFILISYLKSNTPKKIWWTPIQYIFEYEAFFIELDALCCDKNDILKYFECNLRARLKKINGKYTNGWKLLTENRKITDIYIVRTIMYIQDFRDLKYIGNKNYNFCSWFLNNPNEKIEEEVKSNETLNIVDVGLLIQLKNDFIDAFVKDNSDDFDKYDEDYLLKNFNFIDFPKEYEYIKFE